ncbi:hypothetical protein [Mucilaginibacter sp. dw_454]|uniref:hypothetical protein n=1 Tax=Mucilaginibacter sp. dw_454 TaxID=2720079 RepID=UPI001BD3F22C|nr:hypothetical protein [Mucilaginibacter sp. dw_454]
MTFEEFFKKKRIDLAAFQQGEPALFAEFKLHFEQMGEKSFDHTKKYWFNKLRRQFHLAPEEKPEKAKIENQLAEQTITEELSELSTPAPKVGFTPRFKAAVKPVEDKPETPVAANPAAAETEKPKVGFTPRFKAGVTKPEEAAETSEGKKEETPVAEDKPKIGFTPRFKAGVTKPAETTATENPEEKNEETPTADDKPKIGFTPRFKTGVTKAAETPAETKPEEPIASEEKTVEEKPKIGFTPRFKAGVTKQTPPPTQE